MYKIKVLGVCAAQGAMIHSLAYTKKKSFKLLGNVDPRAVFHTKGEEQWKLNFGEVPFIKSLDELGDGVKPDVIVGSPSCGHSSAFSYSRKKRLGNPKEDPSMNLYISSVLKFNPKIFIMENLPKLLSLITIEEFREFFKNYRIFPLCHSVSEFGNSQKSRKRLLLIGVRHDLSDSVDKIFHKVAPITGHEPKTCGELRLKVRKRLNFKEKPNKKLAMYRYWDKSKTTLTVKEVHDLWTGKFKDEYKWPMNGTKMKTLPGVYRNRYDAYPLTLRPSNRQFNPNGYPMGLEEFRIIMGFPVNYKIYFDPKNDTYWLNKGRNALSKGAVYEMGIWVKQRLREARPYIAKIK